MAQAQLSESQVAKFRDSMNRLVRERVQAAKKVGAIIGHPTFHHEVRTASKLAAANVKHPNEWISHAAPPHVKAAHRLARLVYQSSKRRAVRESILDDPRARIVETAVPLGVHPAQAATEPKDAFTHIGGPYAAAHQVRADLRKLAGKLGVLDQVGTARDARAIHALHQRIASIRSAPSSSVAVPKSHAVKAEVQGFLSRWNANRAGKDPQRIASGKRAWASRTAKVQEGLVLRTTLSESMVDEAQKRLAGNLCVNTGQGSGGGFTACHAGTADSSIKRAIATAYAAPIPKEHASNVFTDRAYKTGRAAALAHLTDANWTTGDLVTSIDAASLASKKVPDPSLPAHLSAAIHAHNAGVSDALSQFQGEHEKLSGRLFVDRKSALGTATKDLGNGDLCKTMPSLCAGNHGIQRADMPQVPKEKNADFQSFLKERGITLTRETAQVGKLRATQGELNAEKVSGIAKRILGAGREKAPSPIIVSKDGFVFDGHHRWAAYRLLSPRNKIDVYRASATIDQLLKAANEFPGVEHRNIKEYMRPLAFELMDEAKKRLAGNLCVNTGEGSGGGFTSCNTGSVVAGIQQHGKLATFMRLPAPAKAAFDEAYRTLVEKGGGKASMSKDAAMQLFASRYVQGLKYRQGFDETRKAVEEKLSSIPGAKGVFGRTKAPESIATKAFLKDRLPHSLTDIAGTTMLVDNVHDQRAASNAIRATFKPFGSSEWGGKNFEDMLANPKDGYRGIHFLVDVGGKAVEIQLKTHDQNQWSTVSHLTVYNKSDNPLKRDPVFKRYLELMSSWISQHDEGHDPGPKPPCEPPRAVQLRLCL